ncbi:membrane or secreted protein [Aporhodopirellula aestuarii]|uniref:Membrane or secreted protein n=1 Tax=Aporhodopirellula aestuarii TaxID=2950107 RepID=A0ABT0UC97_9BACT|nr:membrane or secreted protein [Aporhodopirellula aestuarii]MCM2374406.1 membrane or secreted protein [Aporhodopirellula aestuarii]
MRTTFHLGIASCLLFAVVAAGCRGRSFLPAAGNMNQQQANAVVHDPFPLDDIAPNDLGARPPNYQNPLPEPVRNRISADAMPWLGR